MLKTPFQANIHIFSSGYLDSCPPVGAYCHRASTPCPGTTEHPTELGSRPTPPQLLWLPPSRSANTARAEQALARQEGRAGGRDRLCTKTPLPHLSPWCIWAIPNCPGTLHGVMWALESNSCPGTVQGVSEYG